MFKELQSLTPRLCVLLQLWPGTVQWPDYMAPAAVAWYTQQLRAFYDEVPLDGVWIDMDEPSNFCTGDVCVATGVPAC